MHKPSVLSTKCQKQFSLFFLNFQKRKKEKKKETNSCHELQVCFTHAYNLINDILINLYNTPTYLSRFESYKPFFSHDLELVESNSLKKKEKKKKKSKYMRVCWL